MRGMRILVVHNPETGLFASLVSRLMGRLVLYSEGNTIPWVDPYLSPPKLRAVQKVWRKAMPSLGVLMCRIASAIRAQSESIKRGMVSRQIEAEKVVVIPAGVDETEFPPGLFAYDTMKGLNVAFIGRLVEEKGAPLLVEVVQRAVVESPTVSFSVFGEGPFGEPLSELPNVIHLGAVSRDTLPGHLEKIHVVMSFQKEFGRAEIESLAAGKILLACRVGEVPLFIQHLDNGLLCEPNAKEVLKTLTAILNQPALMPRIAREGRNLALSRFAWKRVGEQWRMICSDLMAKDARNHDAF